MEFLGKAMDMLENRKPFEIYGYQYYVTQVSMPIGHDYVEVRCIFDERSLSSIIVESSPKLLED